MTNLQDHKYFRILNNDDKAQGGNLLAEKLLSITGFYPDDYLDPVTTQGGEIVNIIVDESIFKNHYSIALVIAPIELKTPLEIEAKLEALIEKYDLKNIHFSEIFGKKSLGMKRDDFLSEYKNIVAHIPLSCVSVSKSLGELKENHLLVNSTNEEIFHSLFWSCFQSIIETFPEHSIFHLHTEQEYSLDGNLEVMAKKYFDKLYSGIAHTKQHQNKHFSVCKHPHFFTKKALLFSSISDLLAYGSNKLQNKIDVGVPPNKILKEHNKLLLLMKSVFNNYSGMPSKKIVDIIDGI